ncbi:MAG TPA: GntR family transcriptional regulator [Gemmatimonadaceae bacterium]|nr:GntR family transcriptional regulator [Gemmatimonadaceae bacterium]
MPFIEVRTPARVERADGASDLATQVHRQLRKLIVHGQLAPGSRVVESVVAERLGVSRTPVRGALQQLQREGFVIARESAKRAQLTIAPLSRDDGRELFWVVGELEGLAAHHAAALPRTVRDPLVLELRAINEALQSEARAIPPDANHIFDLHTRFHQTYVNAAAGPRLLALHEITKPQAERYRRFYSTALGGALGPSVTEHDAIIDHIADGDTEEAARAARCNWRNAADRLVHTIEMKGEFGGW